MGIEPSAILTFRDEYPELVDENLVGKAKLIAANTLTIEEFIWREFEKGNIKPDQFKSGQQHIIYHGHCQQKSIASTSPAIKILGIPNGWSCTEIPSGCCGMAGSFGFEKEHYDISMKIGELVLFPAVRNVHETVVIAASGTSCRHQIHEGTQRVAKHPVQLLYDALI